MKNIIGCLLACKVYLLLAPAITVAQHSPIIKSRAPASSKKIVRYGVASYYAKKFHGRKTSDGSTYSSKKLSAACNILPLGTLVKVTNLRNRRSVIVIINDRLHRKSNRLIDLSRFAAQKLRYMKRGLTRVKVEVLNKPRIS